MCVFVYSLIVCLLLLIYYWLFINYFLHSDGTWGLKQILKTSTGVTRGSVLRHPYSKCLMDWDGLKRYWLRWRFRGKAVAAFYGVKNPLHSVLINWYWSQQNRDLKLYSRLDACLRLIAWKRLKLCSECGEWHPATKGAGKYSTLVKWWLWKALQVHWLNRMTVETAVLSVQ